MNVHIVLFSHGWPLTDQTDLVGVYTDPDAAQRARLRKLKEEAPVAQPTGKHCIVVELPLDSRPAADSKWKEGPLTGKVMESCGGAWLLGPTNGKTYESYPLNNLGIAPFYVRPEDMRPYRSWRARALDVAGEIHKMPEERWKDINEMPIDEYREKWGPVPE